MIVYLRTREACSSSYDGAAPVISVAESFLLDALTTPTSTEILPYRPVHTEHGNMCAWTFPFPSFPRNSRHGCVQRLTAADTTGARSVAPSASPRRRRCCAAIPTPPHEPARTRANWAP